MAYSCGVFLFWITTLVTQSEQGVLPLPKHRGHHVIRVLNEAPLKTFTNQRELAKHENTMLRKSISDLSRQHKFIVLPYSKFDDNGMVYLSQPNNNEDRKINALMNKIVKYKTEDEKLDGLRTRLQDLFTSEEIAQMENIVADVDGLDDRRQRSNEDGIISPKMVYRFSDLDV